MSDPTLIPSLAEMPATSSAVVESRSLFSAQMPVSYDAAGQVVSRFGDLSWDLRSMSTDGNTPITLHFFCPDLTDASSLDLLIREQHQALMWLHMDAGRTRAGGTLLRTNLALAAWCENASERGVDLYTLLSDPDWVAAGSRNLNRLYVHLTASAVKTLGRHRRELRAPTGLNVQAVCDVLNREARRRPETQQTPLIPSRVYCAILGALGDRMSLIEHELDILLDAYERDRTALRNAPKALTKEQRKTYRARVLADVIVRMKVLGYAPETGEQLDKFIAGRIGEHQVALMLVVAAYTGMRVGEVSNLPLDGVLGEFKHLGSIHYELRGATHKLNKGVKLQTAWITSHQGARAVRVAERIAKSVARVYVQPAPQGQHALLFPALTNPYKEISSTIFNNYLVRLRDALCPVIEQSDINELDQLELARGWARDDIVAGKRWPLAFHQLRRSLAVYAHRSGMVSLPALKAQLQHITQEMTLYYSDGFSRAVNLVFDKDHFSHDWQAARAESSYFAYAFGVLFSDEDLFGKGLARMASAVESRHREDTLRLFQENKLAYRETPLGGCVSTDECKTHPLEPIPYDCLATNCVNMVVFGKRLEHVIKYQEVAVAGLAKDEAGSVEHRLEARHLEILIQARSRLKKGAA
jgi:integrase